MLTRVDGGAAAIVAIGCETEPVSKNEDFRAYAEEVLEAVYERGEEAAGAELDERRTELTARLGENIQIAGARRMSAANGETFAEYVHPPANKIGVLLEFTGGSPELARRLAMHISFSRPTYSSRDDVPAELVEAERAILVKLPEVESKPENVREKIVEGMLNKRFYAESVLGEQAWIHDTSLTVAQGAHAGRARARRLRLVLGRSLMTLAPQREAQSAPVFRRVLLKLSGEALMGPGEFGLDAQTVDTLARELVEVHATGVELALVIGGGNIYRGMKSTAAGMDRATGDYMGMLATVFNSLAVQEALERNGADTRVLSALDVREVAEPYIRRRAIRHLEKGRFVIFAAGTGNPYFTTDTAAALRALEIDARGDPDGEERRPGVFDGDPRSDPDARRSCRR